MMAKKKKSQRKRNFAYSGTSNRTTSPVQDQLTSAANTPDDSPKTAVAPKPFKKLASTQVDGPNLEYLKQDLKMILILAVGAVILELTLWLLLRHTTFGTTIFKF